MQTINTIWPFPLHMLTQSDKVHNLQLEQSQVDCLAQGHFDPWNKTEWWVGLSHQPQLPLQCCHQLTKVSERGEETRGRQEGIRKHKSPLFLPLT